MITHRQLVLGSTILELKSMKEVYSILSLNVIFITFIDGVSKSNFSFSSRYIQIVIKVRINY